MNWKRLVAAYAGVLVLTAAMNFVIHAMLLKRDYGAQPNLIRNEADANAHMIFLVAAFAIFALGFTLAWAWYVRDHPSSITTGLAFGVLAWLLVSVNRYLTYYAVQPWPAMVVLKQVGYELVWLLGVGAFVAVVHRPKQIGQG